MGGFGFRGRWLGLCNIFDPGLLCCERSFIERGLFDLCIWEDVSTGISSEAIRMRLTSDAENNTFC